MPIEQQQSSGQQKLAAWVEQQWQAVSRGRWAEEREWYQAGMFDQMKQWPESTGDGGKRLQPIKNGENKKWPMPVTNHFSKTIATNENSLGAGSRNEGACRTITTPRTAGQHKQHRTRSMRPIKSRA